MNIKVLAFQCKYINVVNKKWKSEFWQIYLNNKSYHPINKPIMEKIKR